jgi:hypothetical protein
LEIKNSDIYKDDILKKAAQKSRILFCNPPFENFKPKEKTIYDNKTGNKAAEVLAKTLPFMMPKSVFGIILPQGFLHGKKIAELRKYILDECELRVICNLPDNVFAKAGHLSTVILGRKFKSKNKVKYLNITKTNLGEFKNTYQDDAELINKNIFYEDQHYTFKIPVLKDIWDYCKLYPKFESFCEIGRGIEYKNFEKSVQKSKFPDAVKGFGKFKINSNIKIDALPEYYWLSTKRTDIENPRYGFSQNIPQIIVNYARSGGDVWRIKGFLDNKGFLVTKHFLVIRPKINLPLTALWALVNSPFTNAFMYCNCMERLNMEGVLRNMPVPFRGQDLSKVEALVDKYFKYEKSEFALKDEGKYRQNKKQCLLEIDAEILRLYDLPPRLEKKLLDSFEGVQRKGVDFNFDRYYEEGFDSYIPLHMYISEDFKNSNVDRVAKWVEKNRKPEIIAAFKKAGEDFKDK